MNTQMTNWQALLSQTAVKWLLLINITVFPIGLIISSAGPIPDFRSVGLIPMKIVEEFSRGDFFNCIVALFRHKFFHYDAAHIFFNFIFLIAAGLSLESVLGTKRFLVLYFTSGAIAAVALVIFASDMTIPLIGASGAIAGLMGASLVLTAEQPLLSIGAFKFTIKAKHLFTLWLVLQIYLFLRAFGNPVAGQMVVHIAGLATGFAMASLWKSDYL